MKLAVLGNNSLARSLTHLGEEGLFTCRTHAKRCMAKQPDVVRLLTKTASREVRAGLLELVQKYTELAAHAQPGETLPPLAREPQRQPSQQQQQPQPANDDKKK